MKIVTAIAVIWIFFVIGCEKSQSPEPTRSQDATRNEGASIDTYETSDAVSGTSLVIIPGQGVGELRFGMSQIEMEKILGKPERTMGNANEYLIKGMAVLGSKYSAVGAILFGDMNNPESPLVKACKFKTDKGIGMGSTLDDLHEAYKDPSSVKPMGKGKMVSYKQLGATFTLQNDKVIHMQFRHLKNYCLIDLD